MFLGATPVLLFISCVFWATPVQTCYFRWTFALAGGAVAKAFSNAEAEARRRAVCTPRTLERIAELRNTRPGRGTPVGLLILEYF